MKKKTVLLFLALALPGLFASAALAEMKKPATSKNGVRKPSDAGDYELSCTTSTGEIRYNERIMRYQDEVVEFAFLNNSKEFFQKSKDAYIKDGGPVKLYFIPVGNKTVVQKGKFKFPCSNDGEAEDTYYVQKFRVMKVDPTPTGQSVEEQRIQFFCQEDSLTCGKNRFLTPENWR